MSSLHCLKLHLPDASQREQLLLEIHGQLTQRARDDCPIAQTEPKLGRLQRQLLIQRPEWSQALLLAGTLGSEPQPNGFQANMASS